MKLVKHSKQGFTLVEMIVVIAIIAILAAVIIPTTAGFIDRARLSNDRQNATRMTQVMQVYEIENENIGHLSAFDVREILDEFSDEPFDFTPSSSNAGYFFDEATRRIVVRKYSEIVNGFELSNPTRSYLLGISMNNVQASSVDWDQVQEPEALFGNGSLLLSTSGSPIATAVNVIRNYAEIPVSWENLKDQTWGQSNFALFRLGGALEAHLDQLMNTFDPEETLFVSNTHWKTTGASINRIVFTPGISNIPTYKGNSLDLGIDTTITIPRTVRSIEADAFSSFDGVSTIQFLSTVPVKTFATSLPETIAVSGPTPVRINESDLIDYSQYLSFSITGNSVVLAFENAQGDELPIKSQVTGYSLRQRGDVVNVQIYTREGLVGYASNLYRVTYHLNRTPLDARVTYFQTTSTINAFIEPPEPIRVGFDFGGWFTDAIIQDETTEINTEDVDPLTLGLTRVYAKWTPAS